MSKFIPLSVPNLNGNELKYVMEAITDEWVSTGGPHIEAFEKAMSGYLGVSNAVACQSGTAGLHIAMIVNGIGAGDEVIVPTLTFIATVNPVKYTGAEPVFMDCDDTLCMDMIKLKHFCEEECIFNGEKLINKRTKRHIKAIIVVHIFGNIANMDKLMDLAYQYKLIVIEDATEALGSFISEGKYQGKYGGTIGTIGIYSFNGNKIITSGGGGMIVSNDEDLLKRAKHLTTQAKIDEIYYTHDEIGYNYRMTNLQAALGLAQLEQLEDFIKVKEKNYNLYKRKIKDIPGLSILEFKVGVRSNYWFYALKCDSNYPLNRDEIISYLSSKGIQSRPIWDLISNQKPYRSNQTYKIEKAKYFIEHIVNIPCSTNLIEEDVLTVVEYLQAAQKREVHK